MHAIVDICMSMSNNILKEGLLLSVMVIETWRTLKIHDWIPLKFFNQCVKTNVLLKSLKKISF